MIRTLSVALALMVSSISYAQSIATFPNKVIRIVVGYAPGGGTDVVARMVAAQLTDRLKGSPVIVENRAGATGVIGMETVAKAAPDGYTLLLGSNSEIISVALKKTSLEIRKAFDPAVQMTTQSYALVANASLPITNAKELVAYARSRPGTLYHGTSGNGSIAHLGMELFNLMTGVKLTHIPYKGGGPAMTDLLSGTLQVLLGPVGSVSTHVKAGKLRLLAISSQERLPAMPDLPTIAESGLPGYELSNIYGLWAPGGSPELAINTINRETIQVIKMPDFAAKLVAVGVEPAAPSTPAEYRSSIEREYQKWDKLFKMPGLDVESFK